MNNFIGGIIMAKAKDFENLLCELNMENLDMIDFVDIRTNTCIFGYGGIETSVIGQTLSFRGIKPPQGAGTRIWNEDGTKVGEWSYTGSQISTLLKTIEEVEAVYNQLKNIEENRGGSSKFKDVSFDFTKYKKESVNVVKAAIEMVIDFYTNKDNFGVGERGWNCKGDNK